MVQSAAVEMILKRRFLKKLVVSFERRQNNDLEYTEFYIRMDLFINFYIMILIIF